MQEWQVPQNAFTRSFCLYNCGQNSPSRKQTSKQAIVHSIDVAMESLFFSSSSWICISNSNHVFPIRSHVFLHLLSSQQQIGLPSLLLALPSAPSPPLPVPSTLTFGISAWHFSLQPVSLSAPTHLHASLSSPLFYHPYLLQQPKNPIVSRAASWLLVGLPCSRRTGLEPRWVK